MQQSVEEQQRQQQDGKAQQNRGGNMRTGLILASVAIAFFVGFIVKTVWMH